MGETEQRGGHDHQRQPEQHRRLDAEPRCCQSRRDTAGERANRVRAREQAGAALGQAELRDVVRQERRQRGVEHRVDEDDRADEREQPPHGSTVDEQAVERSEEPPRAARQLLLHYKRTKLQRVLLIAGAIQNFVD